MSVETARQEILDWVKPAGRDELRAMLDLLVLEAQAAMPCSKWPVYAENCFAFRSRFAKGSDGWEKAQQQPLCPSCAARQRLAGREVRA